MGYNKGSPKREFYSTVSIKKLKRFQINNDAPQKNKNNPKSKAVDEEKQFRSRQKVNEIKMNKTIQRINEIKGSFFGKNKQD